MYNFLYLFFKNYYTFLKCVLNISDMVINVLVLINVFIAKVNNNNYQ